MPPVRWKLLLAVTATCLLLKFDFTEAVKNTPSMTSDGWRPIIGAQQESYHKAITQYRNPSQLNEPIKAEVVVAPTVATPSTSAPLPPTPKPIPTPTTVTNNNIINNAAQNHHNNNKVPAHSKHPSQSNQFFVLPTHSNHGPHIPLMSLRGGTQKPFQKHSTSNKFHGNYISGSKRHMKPIRLQAVAHSTRNEVYLPAPSGTFAYYNQQGQNNNVKVRDVAGGSSTNGGFKPFRFTPLHTHVDFTNHFGLSAGINDNIFQPIYSNPLYNFVTAKPQQNEVQYTYLTQNDEYTRNLVPPPFKKLKEDNKINVKATKEAATETTVQVLNKQQFTLGKPLKVEAPENVVLQLPPPLELKPFTFHHQQQQQQQQQNKDQYDVQITKENLKVYQNNIPPSFNPQFGSYQTINNNNNNNRPETPPPPVFKPQKTLTYEVTESKQWPEPPVYQTRIPDMKFIPKQKLQPARNRLPLPQVQLISPTQFLPTPFNGDSLSPTLPTQSEVSTIFTELSKKQKLKEHASTNSYFNTKEVSTHYPILGKPDYTQTQFPVQPIQEYLDSYNEITTKQPPMVQTYQIEQNEMTTVPPRTTTPVSRPNWQQRRPNQRRRRPLNRTRTTSTTTTETPPNTDMPELEKDLEREVDTELPKVYRYRRPTRLRTTTEVEPTTYRHRYRNRIRPLTEHYTNSEEVSSEKETPKTTAESYTVRTNRLPQTTTEEADEEAPYVGDFHKTASLEEESEEEPIQHLVDEYPTRFFHRPTTTTEENKPNKADSNEDESTTTTTTTTEEVVTKPHRIRLRGRITTVATTEQLPTTNLHIPNNEIEDTATTEETVTLRNEQNQTDEESTLAMTTSTEASTTTKSHRIRGRPINYGANRPRFSVKDYRQRLNQYTSTTTTTESYRSTSSDNLNRYRNRIRRPSIVQDDEESTTDTSRPKFKPKDPRHSDTSEQTITDKPVKVNTRLRPFGRYRSTTEQAVTTQKVSIKPNIFSNLRRPPPISLRSRIYNRNRNNSTRTTTESLSSTTESSKSNISESIDISDITSNNATTAEYGTKKAPDEAFVHSQRVSDLTSSAKNDYNTPGLFKAVSPTSRRVPSYFTISTDDPILPIEAFFPNLKEKHTV